MTTVRIDQCLAGVVALIEQREYHTALERVRELARLEGNVWTDIDRLTCDVLTGECQAFLGQHREAISVCRRAVRKLRRGSDHTLFARACFAIAVAHYYLGDLDQATEAANLAQFTFRRADDIQGTIKSLNWLGNIFFCRADFTQAVARYRECASEAGKHGLRRWAAVARDNMARTYLLMGELTRARITFRGNRQIYLEGAHDLHALRHDLSVSYLDILQRRWNSALRCLERTRKKVLAHSYVREQGVWYEYAGELELMRGNLALSANHLQEAISIATSSGPDESVIGQSRRLLAEVRLAQGNLDEAMAECDRALVSIRKVGERFEEGVVFRVIAEVHSRRGEKEPAIQAFRQSVDILRTIGACLERAKTCLAAGRCTLFGDRERLGYLFEADRLFADVGVEYWTERTRSALGEILQEKPAEGIHHLAESPEKSGEAVMITVDAEARNTMRMAWSWAQEDLAILITGETGTGKDLLARYIHSVSPRRSNPFVVIDLNTIPDALWESELFGHCRGSFTGATEEKAGLLETASGGTVFLNELGNLPLVLQAKLLEFLDTHQIRRLGDTRPVPLDVRFVAATNRPLQEAVDAGLFRADLFFRLEQAPLHLAPLRERREDILPLMRYFLADFGVPAASLQLLSGQTWVARAIEHPWYGNVRQLRNFIWRLVALAGSELNSDFAEWAGRMMDHMGGDNGNGDGHGDSHGRADLLQTLERNQWNQRAAARDLEMSEGNVRRLIHRWGIQKVRTGDMGNSLIRGHG